MICSRDAQLDCLSITDEPDGGEDTSEAEAVEVIEDLGIGFGGEVVARDTLSRGLAPLDGKVRLQRIHVNATNSSKKFYEIFIYLFVVSCSEVLRLTVGLGTSVEILGFTEKSDTDFSRGAFFCFSKCSAIASTSAKVESSWDFNS